MTKFGPIGLAGAGILGQIVKQEFNQIGFASRAAMIAVVALIFKTGLDTVCMRIEHLCVVGDLR